jgi:integrase
MLNGAPYRLVYLLEGRIMPRLVNERPKYCQHKKRNRGRVCIAGKYHYLPGEYNSVESQQAYWALIGRLERGEPITGAEMPPEPASAAALDSLAPQLLTVAEMVEKYKEHVDVYYRQDGKPTGEERVIRYALRPLLDLCPAVLVSEFRPSHLKTVRQEMIARGWCRRHINDCIRRIKSMFCWAVEAELITEDVAGRVKMVKALSAGRSAARELPDVKPVPDEHVEKILPHVSPVAADVIRLMRHCGCRPGEVKNITVEAIDRSNPDVWTCSLSKHKTAYRGRERVLYFGPRCQAILSRWILKAGTGRVFPITHSGLRTVIARGCQRAGVPRFGPNRLRHSAGTAARKASGLEGAQQLLGHAHAKTTEIYAVPDSDKACEVARAIG